MRRVIVDKSHSAVRRKKYSVKIMKKLIYGLLVVILTMLVLIGFWGLFQILKITDIRCYDDYNRPCWTNENNFIQGYKNTFLVETFLRLSDDLTSKFDYLETVNLELDLKRQLTVRLIRVDAVAIITTKDLSMAGRFFRVTNNGIILDEIDSGNKPIYYVASFATPIGGQISTKQQWIIELIDQLSFDNVQTEATDTEFEVNLKVEKNDKILEIAIVPLVKNIYEIREWIRLFMNDEQISSGSKINLSYEKPVLVN